MENLYFLAPVSIFKQDNDFVAYSPLLDLSTCADSLGGAQKMLDEATEIFFEEIERKGTTVEVLV